MNKKVPKVIKVVNLKQFMPETLPLETKPKLKRTWYSSNINQESLQTNLNTDNIEPDSDNTKDSVVKASDLPVTYTIDKSSEESYQNRLLTSRSRIKFRNCSHSPEKLSTLHEHVDETLVKVGDVFESRDSFREYLNSNAKRWHYYYVCRNSKNKIIEYNCICMAYNNKQREVVVRKLKKRSTACPCTIRLAIDNITNRVVVYYVCNHHDHPTTASAFSHYPHAKYLPHDIKEEFLDLTYIGLCPGFIQKYIQSVAGLKIKTKDIWSYVHRYKRKVIHRTLSDERRKYMQDLVRTFKETSREENTALTQKQNEHSRAVEFDHNFEPNRNEPHDSEEKNKNTIASSLANTTNVNINQNERSTITSSTAVSSDPKEEDNLLEEVLCESTNIDTEVIVEYVNEEGILCDENGLPVTNSSAIMEFIDNYTYVTPESNSGDIFLEEGTVPSELVDINDEIYPLEWSLNDGSVISKNETKVEVNEGPGLNGEISAEFSVNGGKLESSERDNIVTVTSGCVHEKRLLPTPESAAVRTELDTFKKYYYDDHRYITYREQNRVEQNAVQYIEKHHRSGINCGVAYEKYIKAPDTIQWPIRHCSGHDHLTLLTACDAILSGSKFLTHDVFLAYINERANRWFFYYSLVESGRSPENYVYKCVYGKHRVSKNAYRAKGLRRRNKLTTQCPCQIRLRRVDSDPDYLTVLYSCNHHDHALDERQFTAQPHSRRLPPHIKEEIKDLLALGVSADVLRKYVASETGLRVYAKYFHNVRVGMRERNEQRHFTEQRLEVISKKIRELEGMYGHTAKETPQTKHRRNQAKENELSEIEMEDRFTQRGTDEAPNQTLEYCEFSDKDDFAEEVCIVQSDTLPAENTAKRSRLETRLQNLSRKEILMKVKKLQESVRCDGLSSNLQSAP